MKTEDKRVCSVCGTSLAGDSELCPVCMLKGALKPQSDSISGVSSELRFEQYRVLQNEDGTPIELGRGAMGVTYKAVDVLLQRSAALKIINARLIGDDSARHRFVREARAAASVRHSNVATVFAMGEADGDYFYAMEFVEGETLEELIRRSGMLKTDLALEIVTQVAAGLAAIHKQQLVHRDIKPSNIMVSLEDGRLETVKIIDLGLAKGVAEEGTISALGSFVGTPGYASPEQFAGVGVDIRSDLYSLGIVLWEMLCGSLPFQGTSAELVHQHQHASLPVDRLAGVPQQVVPLLETLLEKDPALRFQTPNDLLKALVIVTDSLDSGHRLTKDELRSKVPSAVSPSRSTLLSPGQRNKRRRILAWLALTPAVAALLVVLFLFFNRGPQETATLVEKGVAVLPFDNLSANKDDSYFADGVQDEILNNVAKVAQLKVISRTSVMQYRAEANRDLRQIAKTLGVANVLEGTVQRNGNRVRVSTQLIDARKDQTIWAESYDRDLTDIFAIQSDVAQTVAAKLAATLSPAEKKSIEAKPTDNLEAYDLYLRAKELYSGARVGTSTDATQGLLLDAIGLLERATRLDPHFALAYCAIANANGLLFNWGHDAPPERLARAEAAISTALGLQPELPEVHLAVAQHLILGYRNYDGAGVQLAIAKRGLPNNTDVALLESLIDTRQGRMEKAIQELKEVLARDPRNFVAFGGLAVTLHGMRKFDAVANFLDRSFELRPRQPMDEVMKAVWTRFHKTGDTGAVWSAIAGLPQSAINDRNVLGTRLNFSLCDRNFAQAEQLIDKIRASEFAAWNDGIPVEFYSVVIARLRKEPTTNPAFTQAREQLYQAVLKKPQDASLLSVLAILDALLNNKEIAISEAKRAVDLLPISKDAREGPDILASLATVYAWTGEVDQAFSTLEQLTKIPFGVYYGELKRDWNWEPLRQDPRYHKLLAELAPKD
jgi:serine/threonine protein kinase/Flp pilus assembly protein TadD